MATSENSSSWNWGGAMFALLYLALTKRIIPAVLLTVCLFIPIVNIVVMVVLFILGGLKGRQWMESDSTLTDKETKSWTKFFDRIGFYLFWVGIIFFVVWLVLFLLGLGGSMWMVSENSSETMELMQALQGMENMQDIEGMRELEQMQNGQ